jgi:hypothetical protein
MSIINDALKKTEEHLQKNATGLQNKNPPAGGQKPFLLYILILVVGLFLGNLIFSLIKNKIHTAPQVTQKAHPAPVAPLTPPLPLPAQVNTPVLTEEKTSVSDFILNGIFFSDTGGYALINNQIVKENGYVEGAKVVAITLTTVELDKAGQKITLSTNR